MSSEEVAQLEIRLTKVIYEVKDELHKDHLMLSREVAYVKGAVFVLCAASLSVVVKYWIG